MPARQIVLDTETTGLDAAQGDRIIEIGCIELIHRRPTGKHFHHYLNPDRAIAAEAVQVHGITAEFLADKPRFPDIAEALLEFITGAELIIHNAPFDLGFLEQELRRAGYRQPRLQERCQVLDTLEMARRRHPGQKNSLDALCKRYAIDNSQRSLHGALLDAAILADVYLAMTREQVALGLAPATSTARPASGERHVRTRAPLVVLRADAGERAAHARYLERLERSSGGRRLWKTPSEEAAVIPDSNLDTRLQSEPLPPR